MKYIREKVAYLEGLAEGLELDTTTKEGKILDRIIEVLGDITDALDGLADAHDDLEDYVEMIDDDLTDVEEFLLDEEEDEDYFDDEDYYEVVCPNCGSTYLADFTDFEEDAVFCPDCGEQFHLGDDVLQKLSHEHDDACDCGQHE